MNFRKLKKIDILTSIFKAKHNQIDIKLIHPKSLMNSLEQIQLKVLKYEIPIKITPQNFLNFFKIMEIRGNYTKKRLIFEITLPLVLRSTYQLSKIYSIPMISAISNYYYINLENNFIGINNVYSEFIGLNQHDLNSCKTLTYKV